MFTSLCDFTFVPPRQLFEHPEIFQKAAADMHNSRDCDALLGPMAQGVKPGLRFLLFVLRGALGLPLKSYCPEGHSS